MNVYSPFYVYMHRCIVVYMYICQCVYMLKQIYERCVYVLCTYRYIYTCRCILSLVVIMCETVSEIVSCFFMLLLIGLVMQGVLR